MCFIFHCFQSNHQLQVWHQDAYGRNELYSYGFCHIPVSPGFHEIDCVTWRPKGSLLEELKTQFIGGSSQLKVSLMIITREIKRCRSFRNADVIYFKINFFVSKSTIITVSNPCEIITNPNRTVTDASQVLETIIIVFRSFFVSDSEKYGLCTQRTLYF